MKSIYRHWCYTGDSHSLYRGPTGKQVDTVKNCFTNRENVCSEPINVSRRRATHEGKLKLQSHLFSDFSEERKQVPPRLGFAFVPCPATGNVDRLDKCYYSRNFLLVKRTFSGSLSPHQQKRQTHVNPNLDISKSRFLLLLLLLLHFVKEDLSISLIEQYTHRLKKYFNAIARVFCFYFQSWFSEAKRLLSPTALLSTKTVPFITFQL